uniref:Uncharacterized protein n=1 Tax=Anopheles darlingi TaxID=43151 RepID=A0A2M4DIM1_ANODA
MLAACKVSAAGRFFFVAPFALALTCDRTSSCRREKKALEDFDAPPELVSAICCTFFAFVTFFINEACSSRVSFALVAMPALALASCFCSRSASRRNFCCWKRFFNRRSRFWSVLVRSSFDMTSPFGRRCTSSGASKFASLTATGATSSMLIAAVLVRIFSSGTAGRGVKWKFDSASSWAIKLFIMRRISLCSFGSSSSIV